MSRFFRIKPRQLTTSLAAAFALTLLASGPTATAQPVLPVLPEGCVALDENGLCVLPEAPTGVPVTSVVPTQEPIPVQEAVPVAPLPDEEPLQVPVDNGTVVVPSGAEVVAGDVAREGRPTPESDVPERGHQDDRGGGQGGPGRGGSGGGGRDDNHGGGHQDDQDDDHDDGSDDGDDGHEDGGDHDDDYTDGGHDGEDDDHGGGHGNPGDDHGGTGGHDDDDDHGGHGGGKPRGDQGDHTENNTHNETNVSVDVKIPVTIIDNSVTDNSITVVNETTNVTYVTNTTVQETYVEINGDVYSEQVMYLEDYDTYVLACEYDGGVEVTAWYPQGVGEQELVNHIPTRRLPQYEEAATGGEAVAAPVVTTASSHGLWVPVGVGAVILTAAAIGLGAWRRLQRRG